MVCSELHTKIGKREETVCIVETLLVFTVAALHFTVVMWRVWADQFVPDPKARSGQFNASKPVFLVSREMVGKLNTIPYTTAFEPGYHFLQKIGGGIGTLLRVSPKIAKTCMDIVAKHVPADKDGVRIAELDEQTYRQTLWGHTPLTDFWREGRGYERRLQKLGLNTMGDIALCSCGGPREYYNEDLLYKTFGVNAELLIDHAWGWEPTTIADIKAYKPESSSLGSGQVLTAAYPYEKARLVVREMAEELILNLVDKGLVTDQIDLTIGYDTASLTTPGIRYTGPVTTDHYGRKVPKHAHGTRHLGRRTQSAKVILDAAMALFDRIVNPALLVRRVNIVALHILVGQEELPVPEVEQLDLFTDYAKLEQERLAEQARLERESRIQQAALSIKRKFGKNALVKGMDLQEDATAMTRNNQIGGHKA